MFIFKPTNKTYTDPATAVFKPAIPLGRKYSKGDICLINEKLMYSKMILNSNVLREALLNSKDFLEQALEITIKDKRKPVQETTKPMETIEVPKVTKKKQESSESLILDSEDLILDKTKNKK